MPYFAVGCDPYQQFYSEVSGSGFPSGTTEKHSQPNDATAIHGHAVGVGGMA